jgi:hypothetical protein
VKYHDSEDALERLRDKGVEHIMVSLMARFGRLRSRAVVHQNGEVKDSEARTRRKERREAKEEKGLMTIEAVLH